MGTNRPLAQLAWRLYRRRFRRRSGVRSERRLTPRSPRLQIHQHLTPAEVAKNDAAFDHRNDANFPTVAKWVIRTGDHDIRPQQHPLRRDRRGGHSAGSRQGSLKLVIADFKNVRRPLTQPVRPESDHRRRAAGITAFQLCIRATYVSGRSHWSNKCVPAASGEQSVTRTY